MTLYDEFILKHKGRVLELAKKNTNISENGHVMLWSDDPWMRETVWDNYFEKVELYEKSELQNKSARSLVSVG